MIQLSGQPFQASNMWPFGSTEQMIVQRIMDDPSIHFYQSLQELVFEVNARKNIMLSAREMNQSKAQFAVFAKSRCNPRYWELTDIGGFRLRNDVKPSEAIQDIYMNSSQYAFECATAQIIIFYYAFLRVLGEHIFNELFQNIYLYSWHADPDLGIKSVKTDYFLPGDVVYFENPEFNPEYSQWRGENAIVFGDGTYFGHGIGITTAEHILQDLDQQRKPGATRSAYLMNIAARPSFKHLAQIALSQRKDSTSKSHDVIIQHNKSSISFAQYQFILSIVYKHIQSEAYYGKK